MSGGFFRGTSADQDTRFSNKQAKLLKSQKFPPELEHLVDMTKVKMDVIRPWIATRATEFLGFEDEVLINFIYGLLDGKEVDGKQIQIQLTGFMEKNTGKFMKELWGLLLSAQNNVSGVPQQFLDAKEEETRKKKVETDRIAQEIQNRRDRDGRGPERERKSRFEGEADLSKLAKDASDLGSKFSKPRDSSMEHEDKEADKRRGSRPKDRHSRTPPLNNRSPPPRTTHSPTRSNDRKSLSRSRSISKERHKSKSLSASSQSPKHSISPRRRYKSPDRRPPSPRLRYRSPRRGRYYSPRDSRSPRRRRSPYLRQRSPSPFRNRSPIARRSPRRRSPSPVRRRPPSPTRHRSPSPIRRRSPMHRRSPPSWCRSPLKSRRSPSPYRISPISRSPTRRRSPLKTRKSPSPYRRSPIQRSSDHRRRSPMRSPGYHPADFSLSPPLRKSRSPYRSLSPHGRSRRSLSWEHDNRINGNESRRYRDERISGRDNAKKSPPKVQSSVSQKVPISVHSPQRDTVSQSGDRNKLPIASPENFSSRSQSPTDKRKVNARTRRRSRSLSKSPIRKTRKEEEPMNHNREVIRNKSDALHRRSKESPRDMKAEPYFPKGREFSQSPELRKDNRRESDVGLNEKHARIQHLSNPSEVVEHASGKVRDERGSRGHIHDKPSEKLRRMDESLKYERKQLKGDYEYNELHHESQSATLSKKRMDPGSDKTDSYRNDNMEKRRNKKSDQPSEKLRRMDESLKDERKQLKGNYEHNELHHESQPATLSRKKMDPDSDETDSYRNDKVEKRRNKKSDKRKRDYEDTSESDSQIEDKKESKRKRKEEKRLRREEKHRRREERHKRKLERRANKLKLKSNDTASPNFKKDNSDADDSESEQKKLEIELREKALESLRAKKGISQ